jgi:hypothetical protein
LVADEELRGDSRAKPGLVGTGRGRESKKRGPEVRSSLCMQWCRRHGGAGGSADSTVARRDEGRTEERGGFVGSWLAMHERPPIGTGRPGGGGRAKNEGSKCAVRCAVVPQTRRVVQAVVQIAQ